jgi:mannose-6-phosphate isomerase-like protein (cupin superfamily)
VTSYTKWDRDAYIKRVGGPEEARTAPQGTDGPAERPEARPGAQATRSHPGSARRDHGRHPGRVAQIGGRAGHGWCPGSLRSGDYDDGMTAAPVNVSAALASFDEIYSPRIVARMNDYEVRVAHTKGEHVWHVHEDTDEFFLVLDGQFDVAIRDANGSQTTVTLRQGDMFVVPKGTEHKPSSPGASILMFEPSGTSSTGDRHEGSIPAHVDSTTGHELD